MLEFATRRPLIFSVLVISGYAAAAFVLGLALDALRLPKSTVMLLGQAVVCVYVVLLLTRLGWWRECGFARRVTCGTALVYAPWLLLLLLMLTDVKGGSDDTLRVGGFALWALMVGFAEEGLLRGVVLRALRPGGASRAAVVSSLLFGLAHLANMLEGRDPTSTIVQAIYATFIGIGFAGPFVYTGAIWPAIVVHGLIDFVDSAGRGFSPPNENAAVTLGQAAAALTITGVYALYGLWLLRRQSQSSTMRPV